MADKEFGDIVHDQLICTLDYLISSVHLTELGLLILLQIIRMSKLWTIVHRTLFLHFIQILPLELAEERYLFETFSRH